MKIGRNDKCPCQSGKKFKKCCIGKFENLERLLINPEKIPTEEQLDELIEAQLVFQVFPEKSFEISLQKISLKHSAVRVRYPLYLKIVSDSYNRGVPLINVLKEVLSTKTSPTLSNELQNEDLEDVGDANTLMTEGEQKTATEEQPVKKI